MFTVPEFGSQPISAVQTFALAADASCAWVSSAGELACPPPPRSWTDATSLSLRGLTQRGKVIERLVDGGDCHHLDLIVGGGFGLGQVLIWYQHQIGAGGFG